MTCISDIPQCNGNQPMSLIRRACSPFFLAVFIGFTIPYDATAAETSIEVAACKFSLQDMLRQPKDKPLVLTETVMNCGKHGQHSLEAFYGQGWRLIQLVSDEGAGARVAIFERGRQ